MGWNALTPVAKRAAERTIEECIVRRVALFFFWRFGVGCVFELTLDGKTESTISSNGEEG